MLPDLTDLIERVPPGTVWKHLKSGSFVEIVGHGLHEADLKPMIAYWHQVDAGTRVMFFRNAVEFLDGRFELLVLSPNDPAEEHSTKGGSYGDRV